jgi:hypothetical protein
VSGRTQGPSVHRAAASAPRRAAAAGKGAESAHRPAAGCVDHSTPSDRQRPRPPASARALRSRPAPSPASGPPARRHQGAVAPLGAEAGCASAGRFALGGGGRGGWGFTGAAAAIVPLLAPEGSGCMPPPQLPIPAGARISSHKAGAEPGPETQPASPAAPRHPQRRVGPARSPMRAGRRLRPQRQRLRPDSLRFLALLRRRRRRAVIM